MGPLPDSDYRMGRDVWLHIAGVGYPGLVLAWLLPVLALLGLTCIVHVDGFHRGFRAWATISSLTGSFYTTWRTPIRCCLDGPR